mgnify:CR=1 FL=1
MTEQQIAAVKQALELIEPIAHNSTDDPRGKAEEAITALRRALADQALDKMAENARELGLDYEPVEQQPAELTNCRHCGGPDTVICGGQCKQQPAAQEAAIKTLEFLGYTYHGAEYWKPPLGTPPAEQPPAEEPVALQMDVIVVNLVRAGINKHHARELAEHFIKHTRPQPAAWVGLTDEEREAHRDSWKSNIHDEEFEEIEAKLREKNGGKA